MLRDALVKLSPDKLFARQRKAYPDKIILTVTVPAGQTVMGTAAIGSLGHFFCTRITGMFETLNPGAGGDIDDGICHLRGLLMDSAGNRRFFNDYIPLSLWLTPGRRKSGTALNVVGLGGGAAEAAPAQQMFYPDEWMYTWAAGSNILLDTRSDSTAAASQTADVVFHGWRVLAQESTGAAR